MSLSVEHTPLNVNLKSQFEAAKPFPLIVIDNFLPPDVAEQIWSEVNVNTDLQKSNDYIFAKNKFENPALHAVGPAVDALRDMLTSQAFASELSKIYGGNLFVDPNFIGGGLHRGGEDSFLDMHVDFGIHPNNRRWVRELNLLLYLNKNWEKSYGGELQLRNKNTDETAAIEPLFNRMVIMITKDYTFHGYKKINFPPGMYRTSIAAYAYSEADADADLGNLVTTTQWVPEGGVFKRSVAVITPGLVRLKQKLFGSATARKK